MKLFQDLWALVLKNFEEYISYHVNDDKYSGYGVSSQEHTEANTEIQNTGSEHMYKLWLSSKLRDTAINNKLACVIQLLAFTEQMKLRHKNVN